MCKSEWHFHESAHGKGPCDGAGGTMKRLARKASLQMTHQISTSKQLFELANQESNLPNIAVMHRNTEDYETAQKFLESRFADCKSVPGTHKLHYIQPSKESFLNIKTYSSFEETDSVCFSKEKSRKKSKLK